MRGIWRTGGSDDAGMTIIEIVVAAAILFIILTGVLGLIGQTTLISQQANEITVANNAVAGYVEWVRSLDFETIGISGETSGGVLAATETTTTGDYTITIIPTVEDGANDAIKELTMNVTVLRADGLRESFETMVIIRDKDQFITQANQDPALAPKVTFVAPTPPAGSVAYDAVYVDSGGSVSPFNIGVTAEAAGDRVIEQVSIWCDDTYILENSSAQRADWQLETPVEEWTLSPYFLWNTHQTQTYVDENGVEYTVEVIKDGKRSLIVYARDNNGDVSYQTRQIFVDNYPPDDPAPPVTTVQSATRAMIDWPPTSDGTDYADHYFLHLYQQKSAAEFAADDSDHFKELAIPTGETAYPTEDVYDFDWAQPMSRYYATVMAVSPRPLYSENYSESEVAFVTRPRVSGTYAVVKSSGKYTTTVNLTTTPPTFYTWDPQPQYDWWWRYSNGTTGHELKSTPSFTKSFGPNKDAYIMEFWVNVSYKPAGTSHGGGTTEMKSSNKVGPTPTSGSGTFTEGVWTW